VKTLVVVFALLSPLLGQAPGNKNTPVTPVAGESWLDHLHKTFGDTSMGKMWHLGPPPPIPGEESALWHPSLPLGFAAENVILHGSDVYRLNCQGCHEESGLGAPPEINSLIEPVRSTSVAVIVDRMKQRGMDIGRADAAILAKQSHDALLQRFHKGGQNMPAFPQLSEAEIRVLVAYLQQLARFPGTRTAQVAVSESPSHVGEQVVKSTCHICHSAVGTNPNAEELLQGAIPPLNTLTTRTSLPEFVRKVTNGAAISMGTPPLSCRGRMPVFDYLSEEEAADAYLYLTLYPPRE
jgi:mono/diheme cytochrome c family protein